MVAVGFDPRASGLWIPRLTAKLPKLTVSLLVIKYVSDHRTFDLCNPTIPILFKKNLIKCIIKVVNVSKSQYYEFRHNIINLGNQNINCSLR